MQTLSSPKCRGSLRSSELTVGLGNSISRTRCQHTDSRCWAQRTSAVPTSSTGLQQRLHQTWQRVSDSQKHWKTHLAAITLSAALLAGGAQAADQGEVGSCLLQNCKVPLAKCLGDAGCASNLICLNRCNGQADETECQLRCTQIHENDAVKNFNTCAVTEHHCVKTRYTPASDPEGYGPPPKEALDENFELSKYTGKWYISAGLNSAFDTFPCQDHYFSVPEEGKMKLKLNWRIPLDSGELAERSDTQSFYQTKEKAHLINDGNEFMNYRDDWYIIGSRPDKYLLVLYNGNNDAWKGYGGSTLYSRSPTFPREYEKEIAIAAKRANLDWSKFTYTDNSCATAENIKIE